jgi:3'(2'), 5'-bisphosphate nucleotidase
MTFEKILPQLIKLTADVGKVIMSFYKADMAVEMKLNKTPLTIADQRAHQLIVEGLNRLTPNVAILSEESDTATFEQRSKWQEYWLVDPLDGTQDSLEQTGEFCICIAYIKNHQAIFGAALVYNYKLFFFYFYHNRHIGFIKRHDDLANISSQFD